MFLIDSSFETPIALQSPVKYFYAVPFPLSSACLDTVLGNRSPRVEVVRSNIDRQFDKEYRKHHLVHDHNQCI